MSGYACTEQVADLMSQSHETKVAIVALVQPGLYEHDCLGRSLDQPPPLLDRYLLVEGCAIDPQQRCGLRPISAGGSERGFDRTSFEPLEVRR